ncbi:MAG TPA: response regulator transcription factor [Vicinamibacterales bacterium]|jgi:DNA-binding response OmpR family regulator
MGLDMAPRRMLIVEDEQALALGLSDLFSSAGYLVSTAVTGEDATILCTAERFDIVLLDILLPGKNGFSVCAELKTRSPQLPIVMLSARTAASDKVHGLRIGADDYVAKPFDALELLARVDAVLRRAVPRRQAESFELDDLRIDWQRSEAFRNDVPLKLSARQFQLLAYLVERRGQLVTREQLQRDVWGFADDVSTRTVDMHIVRLRKAIERNPASPRLVVTVQGLGYRFLG